MAKRKGDFAEALASASARLSGDVGDSKSRQASSPAEFVEAVALVGGEDPAMVLAELKAQKTPLAHALAQTLGIVKQPRRPGAKPKKWDYAIEARSLFGSMTQERAFAVVGERFGIDADSVKKAFKRARKERPEVFREEEPSLAAWFQPDAKTFKGDKT